jgi:hypothetical protein
VFAPLFSCAGPLRPSALLRWIFHSCLARTTGRRQGHEEVGQDPRNAQDVGHHKDGSGGVRLHVQMLGNASTDAEDHALGGDLLERLAHCTRP